MSDAALAHLSCLQQLQKLKLCGSDVTTASVAAVPWSLTRLVLSVGLRLELTSSTTPVLARLTRLQHLEVLSADVLEPGLLAGMLQLTHLRLGSCSRLLADGCSGAAVLLAVLSGMTALQHLELPYTLRDDLEPAAYSALTASSNLSSLQGVMVPAGAGQQMFTVGRQLLRMQVLKLEVRKVLGTAAAHQHHCLLQTDFSSGVLPRLAAS